MERDGADDTAEPAAPPPPAPPAPEDAPAEAPAPSPLPDADVDAPPPITASCEEDQGSAVDSSADVTVAITADGAEAEVPRPADAADAPAADAPATSPPPAKPASFCSKVFGCCSRPRKDPAAETDPPPDAEATEGSASRAAARAAAAR